MSKIDILGFGLQKADKKISNFDLEKKVDTSDEWIVQRTGIQTRYISEDKNTSELGYLAAKQAIEDANLEPHDIDAIIVATMTGDYITPSTACMIQKKLGINDKQIFAFDLNAACSGFMYALFVASELVDKFDHILVIGSEIISKIIDFNDRNTCVLFGDGAGAVVISKGKHEVYSYVNSEGNDDVLRAYGLALTTDYEHVNDQSHYLYMAGNDVFRFAIKVMQQAIEKVLDESGYTMDDIDMIIPHQANYRIISHVAKKMKTDMSKFFIDVNEFGNTSAASIAIAYSDAYQKGVIQKDSRVILVGFGAGLTYGALLIDGGKENVVE